MFQNEYIKLIFEDLDDESLPNQLDEIDTHTYIMNSEQLSNFEINENWISIDLL